MKNLKLLSAFYCLFSLIFSTCYGQGFLHREGRYIYDGSGNEVILHGIGTGNWMLQEGYMMQTADIAGTQHEFKAKLESTIGVEKTDSFYTVWLHSHFRRIDVDSLKSWGFNSIRVAMLYKWFTPPIEDEPVPGEITWLQTGFTLLDSLLNWCSDNEIYLILDMHGTPGGQGKDAAIADYDPSKPSLWESQENRDKLIALWRKLAERYSNEPWIGGYDLINETNWSFSNGNTPLWNLFKDLTSAIREVDTNHMIILEGNSFANDYTGLPATWDDNMVLSFHKYRTYNDLGSINWMINLRNSRNIPIWLGETGENSNVWYTSLVTLCEKYHIGWSFWPVKKPLMNNPLNVKVNSDYTQLINYWRGSASNPGVDAAFAAVLQFAENHKLENCTFQKDVIDAIFRQPYTTEVIPFKVYKTDEPVFASDYDLGRNGYAYFDNDTSNFEFSNGENTSWNQGWSYRNDGVDLEPCSDGVGNNGYSVGWTEDGEWMEYTVNVDSTAGYTLDIRSASGSSGAKVHLETHGKIITPAISLPGTSGWYNWRTTTINGVILSKGINKIKFVFDQGGSNINYFKLSDPVGTDSVSFNYLSAETSKDGKDIFLSLNKKVTSDISGISLSDFTVSINNTNVTITTVKIDENDSNKLIVSVEEPLYYGGTIRMSYKGNSILNGGQSLETFSNIPVKNNLPVRYTLPRRIQSEDYYFNNGMVSESCSDTGGGYDMGYANPGDYMDYLVYVPETRYYKIYFRVATIRTNNQLIIQAGEGTNFSNLDTLSFDATGGWQSWTTLQDTVLLEEGRYTLRMYIRAGEFNTNWFEVRNGPEVGISEQNISHLKIYPNPATSKLHVEFLTPNTSVAIYNSVGVKMDEAVVTGTYHVFDVSRYTKGIYFVKAKDAVIKFVR